MDLFEDFISEVDLINPQFEKSTGVRDWRNYVPHKWQQEWSKFTYRERKIIVVMSKKQADKDGV